MSKECKEARNMVGIAMVSLIVMIIILENI